MKYTTSLSILTLAVLTGCQSNQSPEMEAALTNLCTTGDGIGAQYNADAFEKAIYDCGGYETFTDAMLIDQRLRFAFYKKEREMELKSDGTGQYINVQKNKTQTINWALLDSGSLRLTFEDGGVWDWRLMSESDGYMQLKTHYSEPGGEEEMLSFVAQNLTTTMQK
ncbi:hypothetical protein H4F17_09570 [Vibrio cholerae]